jgi:hypothetical protein
LLKTQVKAGNVNIGVGAGIEIMDLSASSLDEQVFALTKNICVPF